MNSRRIIEKVIIKPACISVLCIIIFFFIGTDICIADENSEATNNSYKIEESDISDENVIIYEDWETEEHPGSVYNQGTSITRFRLRRLNTATDKYYDQLDDDSKAAYEQMYEAYKDGPCNDSITFDFSNTWEAASIYKENDQTNISAETKTEIFDWVRDIISPAFLALLYDHPECSWLSVTTYKYSFGYILNNASFDADDTSTEDIVEGTGDIAVTKIYLTIPQQDIVTTKEEIDSAVEAAVESINSTLDNDPTRYDIVKAIHDYICNNVSYTDGDTDDDMYQTVYSAFYDMDDDGEIETVCSGYAKAFKVLCDKYDIPVVMVSGTGVSTTQTEAHMWNYVEMEDGEWYAVDTTWDDQTEKKSQKIYYDFFLVGSETVDEYFGKYEFAESHVSNGNWSGNSTYVFQYPVINSEAYEYHVDKDDNELCDYCGRVENESGVYLAGYSLTLNGSIGLNIYMRFGESVINDEGSYMRIQMAEKDAVDVPITDAVQETINGKECYKFTYYVAAKEMTEIISLQMFDGTGDTIGDSYTYSVVAYASSILDSPEDYEEELPLVKAMLRYGAAAQRFFGYNEDNYADSILEEEDKAVSTMTASDLDKYIKTISGNLPEGLEYDGSSLLLETETTIRHYFKLSGDTKTGDYTFTINGEPVPAVDCDTYCYVDINNISSEKLGETYKLSVNDTYTLEYGVFSYGYSVMAGNGSEALQNVIAALWDYWQETVIYISQ